MFTLAQSAYVNASRRIRLDLDDVSALEQKLRTLATMSDLEWVEATELDRALHYGRARATVSTWR